MLHNGEQVFFRTAYKPRLLLAVLLSRAGQTVPRETLVNALWGERPPASARANVQQYVHQLRGALGPDQLLSIQGGYAMATDELDAAWFRALAAKGRGELDRGEFAAASRTLREALDLWQGPAYADFTGCDLLAEEAGRLEQLQLAAREGWLEAELALGRHLDLVIELADLAQAQPYRENLRGHLMLALYRSGRQVEALQAFRDIRAHLREQLGIEPGPTLQRLHEAILRNDQQLLAVPTPWRLPPPLPDFVGRQEELATIEAQVRARRTVAINGLPGIGKTALAVTATHRLRHEFPSGQLYLDLRGHDEPRDPHQVLHRFLRDMGVDGSALPDDVEESAAMYRSLLSQRPRLVLLDNAASVTQIGPLLPPAECGLVVTSRRMLVDLDGACFVSLEPWTQDEALHMLAVTIGSDRVTQEAHAAAHIVDSCGRLPLAVRIAAGRSLAPEVSLAEVARDLSDSAQRLDALTSAERSVRASLQSGYDSLTAAEQRLLRCLALVTADDFPAWIAPAALDSAPADGLDTLDRLVQARFVDPLGVDALGQARFRLHDLVRPFASEQGEQADGSSILGYVADAWHTLAEEADAQLHYNDSYRHPVTPSRRPAMTGAHRKDPRAWFTLELASILDIATKEDSHCWQLVWAAETFMRMDDRHAELMTYCQTGLDTATRAHDPRGVLCMELSLAFGFLLANDLPAADAHARNGLSAADQMDDAWLRAELLGVVAQIDGSSGRAKAQRAALAEAVELYRRAGDTVSAGSKLTILGQLAADNLDEEAALDYFQQGVALLRASTAQRPLAMGLRRLAKSHNDKGEAERAVELYQECLTLIQEFDEPIGEMCVSTELAMTLMDFGAPEEARPHIDRALLLTERVSHPLYVNFVRLGQGMLQARTGDPRTALDTITAAVPHLPASPAYYVTALIELGHVHQWLGDLSTAQAAFREAAAEADRLGIPLLAVRARAFL
ncbi:BTAD domain-containing putative transcriptional regulator [Nonomuraea sp. NPDC050556]|uniref:AfsR/SARP family transcriptional regulator n=1 Tax=Nonomuraea sp. NPDC050556 TaxID=3364369 RepID=UPI0037B465AB